MASGTWMTRLTVEARTNATITATTSTYPADKNADALLRTVIELELSSSVFTASFALS